MKLTIIDIAHHRNGICGAPSPWSSLRTTAAEGSRKIAILFEADHTTVPSSTSPSSPLATLPLGVTPGGAINYEP